MHRYYSQMTNQHNDIEENATGRPNTTSVYKNKLSVIERNTRKTICRRRYIVKSGCSSTTYERKTDFSIQDRLKAL